MKSIIKWLKSSISTFLGLNKFNYKQYWEERYCNGGNSGLGSYGILARYKANFINQFIKEHNIQTVIEFGCGDGNQLSLANYPSYLGLDISKYAISMCSEIFKGDDSKSFIFYDPLSFNNNGFIQGDLVICLDVLYHITSEAEFNKTLEHIFSCSKNFIILYTSLIFEQSDKHIIHRDILPYLKKWEGYKIEQIVNNIHENLTSAKFIVLKKIIYLNQP